MQNRCLLAENLPIEENVRLCALRTWNLSELNSSLNYMNYTETPNSAEYVLRYGDGNYGTPLPDEPKNWTHHVLTIFCQNLIWFMLLLQF